MGRLRAKAIRQLRVRAGARVLELGCGTGTSFRALLALLKPTGQLFGVDRSREMLRQARRKIRRAAWGQVTLIRANADDLAFSRDAVDWERLSRIWHKIKQEVATDHADKTNQPRISIIFAGHPGHIGETIETWSSRFQ